ncbi:MAG: beta strand repeat-containing protein, partial [Acidobacteriota bacterium]
MSSSLTVAGATTLNGAFTLGDNGDTGSINTSDWDISTTGVLTGISGITTDGGYTQSGASQNTFSGNVDATSGLDVTGTSLTVGGSNASITTAGVITGTIINSTGAIQTGGTDRISSGGNLVNIGNITAGGTITFGGFSIDGGLFYANGSGVVAQSTAGTSGQILQSNGSGAPSWVDAASVGTNYWQKNAGVLSPLAIADDLVIGGASTASAKFQVSGTTGDISATGTLTGLTGLSSSGTITFSGLSDGVVHSSSGVLSTSAVTNAELQNSSVTINTGAGLSGGGSLSLGGTLNLANTGVTSLAGTTDQISVSGATGAVTLSLPQNISTTSSPTFNGLTVSSLTRGSDTITDFTGTGLQLNSGSLETTLGTSVDLTSEVTGILPSVNGGTGANLSSATQGSIAYFSSTGVMSALAPTTAGYVLTTNGTGADPTWTDASTLGTNYWQRNAGALSPLNITDDLLVGGTSTASAKFQIFGDTGNATTSGTLTFNGNGIIQTTNKQTLTLGSASTGNIVLNGFSSGIVKTNGSGILSSSAVNLGSSDVTGTLAVGNGGTGATSFTSNGVLYGNSTGAIQAATAGTDGQIFVGNSSAAPAFVTLGGDASINSGTGVLTLANSGVSANTYGSASQVPVFAVDAKGRVTSVTNTAIAIAASQITSGTLPIARGGTNATSLGSAGTVAYSDGAGYAFTALGNAGEILVSNGSSAPTWVDAASVGTNYWQKNSGVLSPLAITDDLAIGGTGTSSALFKISGTTGDATTSGSLTFDTAGVIQTTENQTLTIGGTATGNIMLDSGSGLITLADATALSSSLTVGGATTLNGAFTLGDNGETGSINTSDWDISTTGVLTGISGITTDGGYTQSGASQNTFSGNVDATSGLDVTGASLTVGGNATITTAGVISGTQLNIDNLQLDSNTLSATTGDITLDAAGGNVVFGDADTFIIGGHAGDVAYNVISDSGGSPASGQIASDDDLYVEGTIEAGALYQGANQVCDTSGNCAGGAGGSKWQLNSGVLAPLTASNQLVLGGNTTTPYQFEVNGKQTGKALVSLNETGDQNILTASASGNTVFNVTGTGTLQLLESSGGTFFGTISVGDLAADKTYVLPNFTGSSANICLDTGNCAGSGGGLTGSGTSGQIAFFDGAGSVTSETSGFAWNTTNKRLGIGNDSPVGKFDLNGAVTGKALAILNETGDQDIFTASASGTTRLTLSNDGNLNLSGGVYQSNGVSGITQGAASCVTTTNGIVTGFGACQLGSEQWEVNNGAIYTGNSSLDFLLGATSTASAKFAVLNISGGTPTASISANSGDNATFLTGQGNLGTTNAQTLTIGGTSTGNVVIDSGSSLITFADATTLSSSLTVAGVTTLNGAFTLGDNGDTG